MIPGRRAIGSAIWWFCFSGKLIPKFGASRDRAQLKGKDGLSTECAMSGTRPLAMTSVCAHDELVRIATLAYDGGHVVVRLDEQAPEASQANVSTLP